MDKIPFSLQIKQSNTDEWFTPRDAVKIIIPFLKQRQYKKILCPFDQKESEFVSCLSENGFDVEYSHILDGVDFFKRNDLKNFDAVVSNPPFSKREKILEKLFLEGVPFALILNFNGLFDSKKRWEIFKGNSFELLIPKGRIHFFNDQCKGNAPNFQSVYVCSKILEKQIVFTEI